MIDWFDRQPKWARFVMRMIGFVLFLVLSPIWAPLAIIGIVIGRIAEWLIEEWRLS